MKPLNFQQAIVLLIDIYDRGGAEWEHDLESWESAVLRAPFAPPEIALLQRLRRALFDSTGRVEIALRSPANPGNPLPAVETPPPDAGDRSLSSFGTGHVK